MILTPHSGHLSTGDCPPLHGVPLGLAGWGLGYLHTLHRILEVLRATGLGIRHDQSIMTPTKIPALFTQSCLMMDGRLHRDTNIIYFP